MHLLNTDFMHEIKIRFLFTTFNGLKNGIVIYLKACNCTNISDSNDLVINLKRYSQMKNIQLLRRALRQRSHQRQQMRYLLENFLA